MKTNNLTRECNLIVERTKRFAEDVDKLVFSFDGYVYNPLDYAWAPHKCFLEKYITGEVKTLFLGMNPGPDGMLQTGVPFGEVDAVKNYLHITGDVLPLPPEYPKKILGFATNRHEPSGKRLWGFIRQNFPNPDDFFKENAVFNYCPLGFIKKSETGTKNVTPDLLPKNERKMLENVCNDYLAFVIEILNPQVLIGIGKYAEKKLLDVANKGAVSGCATEGNVANKSAANENVSNEGAVKGNVANESVISKAGRLASQKKQLLCAANESVKRNVANEGTTNGRKVLSIVHPSPLTHLSPEEWEKSVSNVLRENKLWNL